MLPDLIADLVPKLADRTVRATERASAAVERSGELAVGQEAAAPLLLRAEGSGSSSGAISSCRLGCLRWRLAGGTERWLSLE